MEMVHILVGVMATGVAYVSKFIVGMAPVVARQKTGEERRGGGEGWGGGGD